MRSKTALHKQLVFTACATNVMCIIFWLAICCLAFDRALPVCVCVCLYVCCILRARSCAFARSCAHARSYSLAAATAFCVCDRSHIRSIESLFDRTNERSFDRSLARSLKRAHKQHSFLLVDGGDAG